RLVAIAGVDDNTESATEPLGSNSIGSNPSLVLIGRTVKDVLCPVATSGLNEGTSHQYNI
uniref:hypothetical protein n=1 Tax=Halobellus rufus TaxID=1448860 RepID=UPI001E630FE5